MSERFFIQCLAVDSFSREKILSLIPPETLEQIKQTDEKPFFQAYSLAHEGISRPLTIIGDSAKPISWPRKAIQSIKNIVLKGVKFFVGHNEDNSTAGRRHLAEVVADAEETIEGTLHHVVVAHVPKENIAEMKKYDICSQEALVNLYEDNGMITAESVDKITGIALESSSKEKPGFPGALRLGAIQAFEQKEEEPKGKGELEIMDLTTVDFNMLLGEMKRRNLAPHQIFTETEIKADKNFSKVFEDAESLKTLESSLTEKEKELEELKGEKEKLALELGKSTAKERLEGILDDKKATDRQRLFILERAAALEDVTDEGLESFYQEKTADYKASIKILGVEDDPIETGAGESESKETVDKNDYSKAENNEFLESDLEI